MEDKQLYICINDKPARLLMLKNKLRKVSVHYGNKIDRFFTEGQWPRD